MLPGTSYLLTALSADHCDFCLEPFDDAPPPLGQQALASSTSPYQNMTLQNSDNISNLEVCMARADRVVAPAIEYFAVTIEGKQAGQLARMKAARIFDPRFVGRLGYDLGEDAVDALDEFKFYTHPELYPKIQQMKAELPTYLQRVKEIPPYNERVVDGKDSFNLKRWWLGNCGDLPAWVIVMRAAFRTCTSYL